MIDLLPCPFCGGLARRSHVRDGREIICTDCGAKGPPAYHGPDGRGEERARLQWNERHPAP